MTQQRRQLKGPCLVHTTIQLLIASQMSVRDIQERYGVGPTWFYDVRRGHIQSPNTRLIQTIYEDLTGVPLVAPPNDQFDGAR